MDLPPAPVRQSRARPYGNHRRVIAHYDPGFERHGDRHHDTGAGVPIPDLSGRARICRYPSARAGNSVPAHNASQCMAVGCGGISIAYVFVHILPDLAHHQEVFATHAGPFSFSTSGRGVYFAALVGLATFYGLELWARSSARRRARRDGVRRPSSHTFWLQLAFYATFNVIIGYLLLDRDETGLLNLLTYVFAMAMHFVVADQGLREQFYPAYDAIGRWILAAAPILGWVIGVFINIPPLAISALFAFLAGAIVLNVLKHELPEERHSHFFAFALGTALYAALLLATE